MTETKQNEVSTRSDSYDYLSQWHPRNLFRSSKVLIVMENEWKWGTIETTNQEYIQTWGMLQAKRGYDQLIPDDFSICFAIWIYSRRPDLSRTRFFRKVACAWAIFTMTPCRPSQKLREETCLEVPTSFRLRNKPTISYHITWGFSHFVALFFPIAYGFRISAWFIESGQRWSVVVYWSAV